MKISIFGLGYVGCVGMGCLANQGHAVVGIDVSDEKVRLINEGKPTIVENGIDELIRSAYEKNLIKATKDYVKAVKETDVSFICVGTPSSENGHLDLRYIFTTAGEIGEALKDKQALILSVRYMT